MVSAIDGHRVGAAGRPPHTVCVAGTASGTGTASEAGTGTGAGTGSGSRI